MVAMACEYILRLPAGHREVARRLLVGDEPGETVVDRLPIGPIALVRMSAGEDGKQGQAGRCTGRIGGARPGTARSAAPFVIIEGPTAVGILTP